jgi:hypothetical protein
MYAQLNTFVQIQLWSSQFCIHMDLNWKEQYKIEHFFNYNFQVVGTFQSCWSTMYKGKAH